MTDTDTGGGPTSPGGSTLGDESSPGHRAHPLPRMLLAAAVVLAAGLLGAAGALLLSGPGTSGSGGSPTPVDIGFAQDMIVHHRQAVTMASWERDYSGDPALRALAYDIESTQTEQLGRMQGWLALWGAAPANGQHMAWMGMSTTRMPGMATAAEQSGLRAATGRDLDVRFLQLMLRHHTGGTGMLAEATGRAQVPAVRALAGQMLEAQTAESQQLRVLLTERGVRPSA